MKIKEVCSKVAFNSTSVAISKLIGDYIFWWCENVLEIWLEQKKFCKVAWNLFHHILIRKIRPFTPINHAHGHMILAERGWGRWGWTPLPPPHHGIQSSRPLTCLDILKKSGKPKWWPCFSSSLISCATQNWRIFLFGDEHPQHPTVGGCWIMVVLASAVITDPFCSFWRHRKCKFVLS